VRVLISLVLLMGFVLGSHASDSSQSPPVRLRIDLPQMTDLSGISFSVQNDVVCAEAF
jgi:hypothetical protein